MLTRRWSRCLGTALVALALVIEGARPAQADEKKSNILVIMGDDIGWFNPSIYHRGIMGYETPNIDRIGKHGTIADPHRRREAAGGGSGCSSRSAPRTATRRTSSAPPSGAPAHNPHTPSKNQRRCARLRRPWLS